MSLRCLVPALAAALACAGDAVLWSIAEPSGGPGDVAIPAGAAGVDGAAVPRGLRAAGAPATDIAFALAQVPEHGAVFAFRLLDAPRSGAQMGVFANAQMAGLVQLWGSDGSAIPYRWRRTYRVHIPAGLLRQGRNVLRLTAVRPIWSDAGADPAVWWAWDRLSLTAPGERPREAVHGAVAHLGTTFKHGERGFAVDDATVRFADAALPWLGVAWSGNTMRADFWYDVAAQQPGRRALLELFRDRNCTVLADHISGSHWRASGDGRMPPHMRDDLRAFMSDLGPLIQWYELGNEPCMFGGGYAEYLETARTVNGLRPAWMRLVAPGWAYGGGKGTPVDWDAAVGNRRAVEALCQAINGHSYGYSYADDRGGSFIENLRSTRGVDDGWPVEFINSETGTNAWHSEENGPRLPSGQPRIQAFDRILRAHIAVVDRTMQHAAAFGDYGIFAEAGNGDPATLAAYPAPDGPGRETRLAAFRRIACAYATHGAPLPWTVANRDELAHRLVYVRALDTAAIPGQRGSGATSTRVLINLVNFEAEPAEIAVSVALPTAGRWLGERYGAGDTLAAARRTVDLAASPQVALRERLGPGEAVQYILVPPAPAVPWAPSGVRAEPSGPGIALAWSAAAGSDGYSVRRRAAGAAAAVVASGLRGTAWTDPDVVPGTAYAYEVGAANAAGASAYGDPAVVIAGTPPAPRGLAAAPGDGRIAVRWEAVPGADGYVVERCAAADGAWSAIGAAPGPELVDRGAANGAAYRYRVAARNAHGVGVPGEAVAARAIAPPPVPAAEVVAGAGIVALRWAAVPGADGYRVLRDGTALGHTESTAFADRDPPAGGAAYAVLALAGEVAGPASAAVAARPDAVALPAIWRQSAIGAGSAGGSAAAHPSGAIAVRGAGADIWGAADGLQFVHAPLPGDGGLACRVVSLDATHDWARAGVMIRASAEPGAAMAMVALTPARGGNFLHRAVADGPCAMVGGDAGPWLRLERRGDAVTGYASADGTRWRRLGEVRLPLGPDASIGLAVCSHRPGTVNAALFDHVRLDRP